MIDKLSRKLNLTPTELKLSGFLIVSLIIGFILKFLLGVNEKTELSFYNYSQIDSIFLNEEKNDTNNSEILNKNVDYKREVFDFNERGFNKVYKKQLPAEKSINLNKATKEELMNLPGIGEKTAESIIEHRNKLSEFRKLEDLLNVKGIGSKKLDTIKKYLYIE
ncbi:helix-hairpin-helix domain-containing protein [Ignavibacterium sp.]|uniref:ComEA family DNA-binding protein n=1 Tax=Ignavibacterium sp. TaxID=2651167 RepID=UPI00307E6CB3